MESTVVLVVSLLVILVSVVVSLGAWLIIRVTSMLTPIQKMLEKQSTLIDKLVTIVVAKGPLEYSTMRAADSLVSYDEWDPEPSENEGTDHGEETVFTEERPRGDIFGDPFIDGTIH